MCKCCSAIGHVVQEAEKRTRALSTQESEMAQARADIQHERERHAEEVDSRTRRSREECDYKVDLERYAHILLVLIKIISLNRTIGCLITR